MKRQVCGRKVGSQEQMVLLLESEGPSTGGQRVGPCVLDDFALANTRRQVLLLRGKNIEGYVLFENDPIQYEFSPHADFVYPAAIH